MERQLREAMDAAANAQSGARGETVAVLPTDILFESGSADLSPEGVARLADVADRLRAEFAGREVRIEGYTDDRPIGPSLQTQYPSNWELSAARASIVARHLQWTHNLAGSQIEVVGLGPYHPLAGNDTPEGRQQNRRVRIAVMGG
jgi:chemotaxis protein MotB